MFDGIAFLQRGDVAIDVSSDDLMVRVGPGTADEALAQSGLLIDGIELRDRVWLDYVLATPAPVARSHLPGKI